MPASEPHHLSPKRGGSFVIVILSALRHTIHYRRPITTRTQAHRGHHPLSGRPRCVGLVPRRRVVVQRPTETRPRSVFYPNPAMPRFSLITLSHSHQPRSTSCIRHRVSPPCTPATRPVSLVRFASPFAPHPDCPLPSCASSALHHGDLYLK